MHLYQLSCVIFIRVPELRTILSPEHLPPTSINLAVGVLGAVTSILVDTILLLRLIAVYPRAYVGQSKFIQLITLPIIVKIARVINLLIFIKELAVRAHDPVAISKFWVSAPYLKIEWFMQLFDNAYVVFERVDFELSSRTDMRPGSSFGDWHCEQKRIGPGPSTQPRQVKPDFPPSSFSQANNFQSVSFAEKLKTLIWISITNFVVPALFSLAQIIIVYREVNYVIVNDIVLVNTKLSVFGVVFATIWAGTNGKRHGSEEGSSDADSGPPREPALSALVFQSRNTDTTRSGGVDLESGAQVEEKEKRVTD